MGLGTYRSFDAGRDVARYRELAGVLKALVGAGGSLVDSSPMYGSSESVVGELSEAAGLNGRLFMATKVWVSGRDQGIAQMSESFSRFRRKKMDLMQIHNLVDWKVHLPTLREWKKEGRIRYIGIAHYTPSAFGTMEQIPRHRLPQRKVLPLLRTSPSVRVRPWERQGEGSSRNGLASWA